MYDDEFPPNDELLKLAAKYENIWASVPEVAAMPREVEAIGGMQAGMALGGGVGDVGGPRSDYGDYIAIEGSLGDHEAVMKFHAGKLAIAVMCATSPREYPLAASSIRLVARIAEEFLGNLPEILRLARQLKEEGQISPDDVEAWTRSNVGAVGVSADERGGVPQANVAGDAGLGTHCESRGGEPSK
jgi:hypothetical protein